MEFTPEWIQSWRNVISYEKNNAGYLTTHQELVLDCLDEIQRLQSKLSAYENDLVLLNVSNKLEKAEERIAELEEQQRWIPVSERLPEKDDYYSVAFRLPSNLYITDVYYYISATEYKWFTRNDAYRIATFFDRVTHWRPKPQPPKEE